MPLILEKDESTKAGKELLISWLAWEKDLFPNPYERFLCINKQHHSRSNGRVTNRLMGPYGVIAVMDSNLIQFGNNFLNIYLFNVNFNPLTIAYLMCVLFNSTSKII